MLSLSLAFNRANLTYYGLSPLWIMFWIVAIDDDRQRREKKERRRKRQAIARQQPVPRPACAPRPF